MLETQPVQVFLIFFGRGSSDGWIDCQSAAFRRAARSVPGTACPVSPFPFVVQAKEKRNGNHTSPDEQHRDDRSRRHEGPAQGKALGPEKGLAELTKIPDPSRLRGYPFYPAAQGEFHLLAGRPAEAAKHFEKAMKQARSRSETNFFERKLRACR